LKKLKEFLSDLLKLFQEGEKELWRGKKQPSKWEVTRDKNQRESGRPNKRGLEKQEYRFLLLLKGGRDWEVNSFTCLGKAQCLTLEPVMKLN